MIAWIRRAPAARLALAVAAAVAALAAAVVAAASVRAPADPPPHAPLGEVLALVADGQDEPVSGRVGYTNDLVPSLDLGEDVVPSALLASGSGRYWADGGDVRVELQSDQGDTQLLGSSGSLSLIDAATGFTAELPGGGLVGGAGGDGSLGGPGWSVEGPEPVTTGGRPAYRLVLRPDDTSSLLAGIEVDVDAEHGAVLAAGVLADGHPLPVLGLRLHDVSFGGVGAGVFDVQPPPDAAAPAPLAALAGAGGPATVVAGSGLSQILAWRGVGGGLPVWAAAEPVTVGGRPARELATPLFTALLVEDGSETVLVAGVVPPEDVRRAAEAL
jgi:hypothetical protein